MYHSIKVIIFVCMSVAIFASEVPLKTHNIEIEGNVYIDDDMIHDALDADTNSLLTFWRDDTPKIKDGLIPTLKETLQNFYASEGFHDATFTVSTSRDIVKIDVKENKPVVVTQIDVQSDFDISNLIIFKKKNIFRSTTFIGIKNNIIGTLLDRGYCSYDLDTKAYVDLDKRTAKLVYKLKKGDVCTFGDANIEGLKTIDKDVILSRVRSKKGERFDPKKVKETYVGIYGLNSFDSVQVNVDRKIFNEVPIDIHLNEVEAAYHFEIGAGYDTYIGPRVHASILKKNFFGNAKQTGLKLSWSQKEQQAIGHFYKPALLTLFERGIDFGLELGHQNLEFRGFQEEKQFAKIYLEYGQGKFKISVGLGLEDINIQVIDNLRDNEELLQAISEGDFLLFYPYIDIVYDARDDKLNPKYGYYLGLLLEYGLPYKDNASTYVKTFLEGRLIHTFDLLTLSAVGKMAVIDEASNPLPESKLFFAGGSFSNRAYGFNSVGVIESKSSDSIAGGLSMLNLSLEANYPIHGNLYGAVFNDNTMLTDKSYDFTGHVISSLGIGLRYVTPIGPFKIDIGFNVNDPSQNGISFQIGQSF